MATVLDVLEEGDQEPACDSEDNLNNLLMQMPEEVDIEKFDRGRHFFKNNVTQCLTAMLFSLVCGLSIKRFLKVLVRTDMSSTPEMSLKRYMRTTVHVLKWHYGNVWNVSSSAHKSVLSVRKMHCSARSLMIEGGPKEDSGSKNSSFYDKNNADASGHVYLSQYDMGLVQCGFMGAIIMYPDKLGIRCSREDLDDYVYFWRWIGYMLGIKDKYNICINGYDRAYNICRAIDKDVLIPSLLNPPDEFLPMARAFTDGVSHITLIHWFTPESVVARYFEVANQRCSFSVSVVDLLRMYLIRAYLGALYYFPFFASFINRRVERLFNCGQYD